MPPLQVQSIESLRHPVASKTVDDEGTRQLQWKNNTTRAKDDLRFLTPTRLPLSSW
jgi:hypothetical protein